MATNIRKRLIDFKLYEFWPEMDSSDFILDNLNNYTDTMGNFKDK